MPAVLVTWPTATQNSPFLPQRWPKPSPVLIEPTHGGMARLSGLENNGLVDPPQLYTVGGHSIQHHSEALASPEQRGAYRSKSASTVRRQLAAPDAALAAC